MSVLSDQNLQDYKKYLDELQLQANAWKSYASKASDTINSATGSTFRTNYAKGKKATENIKAIVDILNSLEKDLMKLVSDASAFYVTSLHASKK